MFTKIVSIFTVLVMYCFHKNSFNLLLIFLRFFTIPVGLAVKIGKK